MLLSYPGVLQQQQSDKGNDARFYKTLKGGVQPMAKSGQGADVSWPVARGKGQIFKQALRFGTVLSGLD